MSLIARLAALMVISFALGVAGDAEAQNTNSKAQATRPAVPTESALRAPINEWTAQEWLDANRAKVGLQP
jgi:hypothetical protein